MSLKKRMHKLRLGVRYDRGQWFVSVVEIMSGHCVYGDNSSRSHLRGQARLLRSLALPLVMFTHQIVRKKQKVVSFSFPDPGVVLRKEERDCH